LSPTQHRNRTSRLPSLVGGSLRSPPTPSRALLAPCRALGGARHRWFIYK